MSAATSPGNNLQQAHKAGKHGWPAPKQVSSHNYTPDEQRQWEQGRWTRFEQQYRDLVDTS